MKRMEKKMTNGSTLVLTHSQVRQLMPYSKFNAMIETVFREWGNENVVMPSKIHLDMTRSGFDSWNNAMPAFIVPQNAAGIKWIGGYQRNPAEGLPYIRGLVVLTEPENGDTLAVMDGTYISDWRTGASAAVAVKYLAKKDMRQVVVVGAGTQGKTAAVSIHGFFPEARITAADISAKRLAAFREELEENYHIPVRTTTDTAAAVLLTTASRPFIRKEWLLPGVLMLGMGSCQQADGDALLSFDKIVVDSVGQAAHRGEIKHLVESGRIPETALHPELGFIVAGKAVGRGSDMEKILCVLVGLGAHDVFAAAEVYRTAKAQAVGLQVRLDD